MSRSYKKQPYPTYKGSKNERQMWSRILRHEQKQQLNNCLDWDELILNTKTKIDADPYLDCIYRHRYDVPALNQCELDYTHSKLRRYGFKAHKSLNNYGHHIYCNCYTNKKSKYWKMMRK